MPSNRLVVVSNRVSVATGKSTMAGGLAVALQQVLNKSGGIWFGWSGKVCAKEPTPPHVVREGPVTYCTIDLTRKNYNEYYSGFANRVLWPLFHYRLDLTAFSKQNYSGYLRVNDIFVQQLLPFLQEDDIIWVHDYHLIPTGEKLRNAGATQPLGIFLHTPFPATEILTALPSHGELVKALCAYDVVGFQTDNDLHAFLDYIVREAGGRVISNHLVHAFDRTVRVGVFPIGIDTEEIERAALKGGSSREIRKLQKHLGHRQWIIGVDRLDYSKGLVERFHSFERLLEAHPKYRTKVMLIQIAPSSRSEVPEYKEIRHELEAEAGHINGRFAEFDWVPINYLNTSYSQAELAGLYRSSRIGLVTPLRDGMNLVAKEYVAAQNPRDPGVLVLSRFAGAARELDAALIVNPLDYDGVADAIVRGLEMSLDERIDRWNAMMARLRRTTIHTWCNDFIAALREAPYDTGSKTRERRSPPPATVPNPQDRKRALTST